MDGQQEAPSIPAWRKLYAGRYRAQKEIRRSSRCVTAFSFGKQGGKSSAHQRVHSAGQSGIFLRKTGRITYEMSEMRK